MCHVCYSSGVNGGNPILLDGARRRKKGGHVRIVSLVLLFVFCEKSRCVGEVTLCAAEFGQASYV